MRQRDIVVLYMNLRPVNNGFPQRDEVPSRILTENLDVSNAHYGARCCAFFTAIFTILRDRLLKLLKDHQGDAATAIRAWNDFMCDMTSDHRAKFFDFVESEYNQVRSIHDADKSILMVR